jgi:O-antigen ligase
LSLATYSADRSKAVNTALALGAFWLMMSTSSFVLFEPAPFDVLFMALFGLFMLLGLRVPHSLLSLLILVILFMGFSVIGTTRGNYFEQSIRHVGITGLLCAVSLFVACFIHRYGERGLRYMLNGWVVAGLVTSLLGIAGYFDLAGGYSETFTLYSRAKGTFKDPNVLAPFIVVPMLYCIYEIVSRRGLAVLMNLGFLGILMIALLLSFSRGGWAHFAFSALLAGSLWLAASRDGRFRFRLIMFAAMGTGAAVIGLGFLVNMEAVSTLFETRAQLTQSYDSAGHGRFAGQLLTFAKILDHPLGLGALGFLPDWFEQPHNVYLYVFMIGGWGAGVAYIVLVILTMARGFQALKHPSSYNGLIVVLIASFIGEVVEGFIVDTDHWRHFYLLLGALWGTYALSVRESGHKPAVADPDGDLRGTQD